MKCPICEIDLVMSDRQGIEIDYCPKCRGVWLDRGELDKIIEKSNNTPQAMSQTHHANHGHDTAHSGHQGGYYQKHKKHSILGELFDF